MPTGVSKVNAPAVELLTTTLPESEPALVDLSPICNTPSLIVVPPLKLLPIPVKVRLPLPLTARATVPAPSTMLPPKVSELVVLP